MPPDKQEQGRKEILNHLIDTALVDQYILQLPQLTASKEEVDKKLEVVRAELAQQKKDFNAWLGEMRMTEAELRQEVAADLRWNKYCDAEATDARLRQLFDSDKDVFNGAMVRARHILLTPDMNDPKADEAATAQLRAIRKDIEDWVAAVMAWRKDADVVRERKRQEVLDDAFAEAARKYSQCPSKDQGGDVDYFQREGRMFEPFAKAAFALNKWQMSDVVQTPAGLHLILVIDRKDGIPNLKYEDIKDDVRDEFCDRLRDAVVAKVSPTARIELAAASKLHRPWRGPSFPRSAWERTSETLCVSESPVRRPYLPSRDAERPDVRSPTRSSWERGPRRAPPHGDRSWGFCSSA